MKICRVGVESLHEDRETDRHDKAKFTFCNFFNTHLQMYKIDTLTKEMILIAK